MGPPPDGTFDVDSDAGPNWVVDSDTDHVQVDTAGSEVDSIADSEPDTAELDSKLYVPHRMASHSCPCTIGRDLDEIPVVPWIVNIARVGSLVMNRGWMRD